MKYINLLSVGCVAMTLLTSGVAGASEDLAKKYGCAACHTAAKKVVGPSWNDIAAKYKGDAKAVDSLALKVKAGGKGAWGNVPMPPQTKVSDADLKAILAWVMTH